MREKFKNLYTSENELCRGFAEYAQELGWKVYPETSNQDMLLIATDKVEIAGASAGTQIGVQAKMVDNLDVLAQAMPSVEEKGPHYHAVLVPRAKENFKYLARRLRIVIFTGMEFTYPEQQDYRKWRDKTWLKSFRGNLTSLPRAYQLYYDEPLWHPDIEIWTPPGVKSPKSLSPWKINSVRLCLHGLKKGYLTSADFKEFNISMKRWVDSKWIVDTGEKHWRYKKFVLNTGAGAPHEKWPEIAEAIKAEPT